MKIAVICPSEIAFRRFMPALQLSSEFEFVGIGVNSVSERFGSDVIQDEMVKKTISAEHEKAQNFINNYGGKIFESYEAVVASNEIDAVYIPLPPALHYKWAKLALQNGKHVLVEKPATLSLEQARELCSIALENGLALHENYMFIYHNQLDEIDNMISSGEIGDIRLYRISFGFPMRAANDFRYNKALGGGALIDAGGYTLKYASRLLGDSAKLLYASMNGIDGFEVDMYGNAAMKNDYGICAQSSYGMDNDYKCELEAWGSKGSLTTNRVLTAPVGYSPTVFVKNGDKTKSIRLEPDDSFKKSIYHFYECVVDEDKRKENYSQICRQATYVDEFRKMALKNEL